MTCSHSRTTSAPSFTAAPLSIGRGDVSLERFELRAVPGVEVLARSALGKLRARLEGWDD